MNTTNSLRSLHWLPVAPDASAVITALRGPVEPAEATFAKIRAASGLRLDFLQIGALARAFDRVALSLPDRAAVPTLRLGWLAECTVEHLVPATRIAALRRGLVLHCHIAPYGQLRQTILDGDAELASFRPDVLLLSFDPFTHLAGLSATSAPADVERGIASRVEEVRHLWRLARDRYGAIVLHETTPQLAPSLFGGYDTHVPGAARRAEAKLGEAIVDAAIEDDVLLLDLEEMSRALGRDAWFDPIRWHQAKQLVSPAMSPLFGDRLARTLAAMRGLSKKCLVLDLDNTLWGGVIGDDGLEGIVLGQGSAAGEAFASFQRYLRQLRERGILLAVCSKNDNAVAEAVFREHTEMILRREDISVFVANWDDKAQNLRRIAERLNLGLDSLVFFDDNPAERELVRQELPMVAVPDVGPEPALYVRILEDAGYFEATSFTADDRQRQAHYEANAQREEGMKSTTDMPGFLRSLAMKMRVAPFDEANLSRVVQLINKTNQFNLTTRRCTDADARRWMSDPATLALYVRLEDRFGDNGLVSVVVAAPLEDSEGRELTVHTWLMSCRVLGRGVERAVLDALVERARARGVDALVGEYVPTAKNAMVGELYPKWGFRPVKGSTNVERYRLELCDYERFDGPITVEHK